MGCSGHGLVVGEQKRERFFKVVEMGVDEEKRNRLRVDYEASVIIQPQGLDQEICGRSTNISMTGLYASSDFAVEAGTPCEVSIFLQGQNSLLTMEIGGTVVRSNEGGIAVQFDNDLEWWAIFTIYAQFNGRMARQVH